MTKIFSKVALASLFFLSILLIPFGVHTSILAYANDDIAVEGVSNLSEIQYVDGVIYALADNTKMVKVDANSQISVLDLPINSVQNMCVMADGSVYFSKGTSIRFYNSNLAQEQGFFDQTEGNNSGSFSIITEIVRDFQGNVYALGRDSEHGEIYHKTSENDYFELYASFETSANISSSASLVVSYNSQKILFVNSSKIYDVDNSLLVELFEVQGQILDAKLDYLNNLYLLIDNGEEVAIQKYILDNLGEYQESEEKLNILASCFDFDYECGDIYSALNNVIDLSENHFVDSLTSYVDTVDWKEKTLNISGVKIGAVSQRAIVYKQPVDILELTSIQDDKFIILDKLSSYTYGLFNVEINGVMQLQGGYILNDNYVEIASNLVEQSSGIAVANNIKIYKYPTSLIYNSGDDYEQLFIQKLNKGASITILDDASDYIDNSGLQFYKISLPNTVGYILRSSVAFNLSEEIHYMLSPNAEIKTNETSINVYSDIYATSILGQVSKGTLVHVFQEISQNGYIKIQYLDSSNQVCEGFVEGKCVSILGISLYIILGIGILLLAVIIALIIIFIKTKRKNKQSQKDEKSVNIA